MLRNRLVAACAAAAVLAALSVGAAAMSPRLQKQGSLYRIERGEAAYSFDAAWRVETLWVRGASGRWEKVKGPPETRMEPLRRLLLSCLGRNSLKEVPVEGGPEIRSLKSMGYL